MFAFSMFNQTTIFPLTESAFVASPSVKHFLGSVIMTVKGLFAKQIGTIQEMRLLFLFANYYLRTTITTLT